MDFVYRYRWQLYALEPALFHWRSFHNIFDFTRLSKTFVAALLCYEGWKFPGTFLGGLKHLVGNLNAKKYKAILSDCLHHLMVKCFYPGESGMFSGWYCLFTLWVVSARAYENENNMNHSLWLVLSPLLNSVQHLGVAMETACSMTARETLKNRIS